MAATTTKPTFRDTFTSPWSDHSHRNGQTFEVIRQLDPVADNVQNEDEAIWEIRFPDGETIHAYSHEIVAGVDAPRSELEAS